MNRRPTASPQGDWTKCLVPLRLRVCFYHPECMGKFTFRATNGVQFSSRLLLQSVSLYLCLSLSDVHDWIAPSPSPLTTTCSTRPGLPSSGPSCSTVCACVCPLVRACVLVPVHSVVRFRPGSDFARRRQLCFALILEYSLSITFDLKLVRAPLKLAFDRLKLQVKKFSQMKFIIWQP